MYYSISGIEPSAEKKETRRRTKRGLSFENERMSQNEKKTCPKIKRQFERHSYKENDV